MAAFDRLKLLARDQATGELIAASAEVEVHVYLQRGRVAWATSSAARSTFRDHLQTSCGVDEARLGAAIERARLHQVTLRAALVESGLATVAQVREAVKAQVAPAVRATLRIDALQVVFLPRGQAFAGYDPELTFELKDLAVELPPRAPRAPAVSTAEVARELLTALPRLHWLASVEGDEARAWSPAPVPPEVLGWHRATFPTGAAQVLLRADGANILGARLPGPGDGSLWGRVDQTTGQQAALELFSRRAQPPPLPAAPPPRVGQPLVAVGRSEADERALQGMLAGDAEVRALATVSPGRAPYLLASEPEPLRWWQEQLEARAGLFDAGGLAQRGDPARLPVAALRDESGWWYATPLPRPLQGSLWVLAQPGLNTGLGFALARSLSRRMGGG